MWFVVAGALALAELATLTLYLAIFSVAAVAGGVTALLGFDLPVQLAVAAAASVGGLVVVRPLRASVLPSRREHRTGVDALVGSEAVVLEPTDTREGRVRLAGEVWSARAVEGLAALPTGTPVQVVAIEGATAVVFPREEISPA